MQVKFIQVADLHLDTNFLGLLDLDKIALRKKELGETFKKIIQYTNTIKEEEGLDFIAFAGDLFEQDYFSPQTIKSLIIYGFELLKPLPVFIVAGNHDPLQNDSPYLLYDWPENVHIFGSEFESFEIKPGVFIYGISVAPENLMKNVLKELEVKDTSLLNIVLMHSAEGGGEESKVFGDCLPFSSQEILESSADYFILGHYHNFRKVPREDNVIKGYYSGSPESLSFKETSERYVLKVKLEKGKSPEIEKISFQHRIYKEIEIDCTGLNSSEEVKGLLLEYKDENAVLNIILKGDLDPDVRIDIDEVLDFIRMEDLFFAANLKNKIRPNYTQELISSSPLAKNFITILDGVKDKYQSEIIEAVKKMGLDAIFTKEVRNWNEI